MKIINVIYEDGENANCKIKKYVFNTGYTFVDFLYDNGEEASFMTTKTGKTVDINSRTFKDADKIVDRFANSASRSKL